jgi:hypothetical protein
MTPRASSPRQDPAASRAIDAIIKAPGDWRSTTLARLRAVILSAGRHDHRPGGHHGSPSCSLSHGSQAACRPMTLTPKWCGCTAWARYLKGFRHSGYNLSIGNTTLMVLLFNTVLSGHNLPGPGRDGSHGTAGARSLTPQRSCEVVPCAGGNSSGQARGQWSSSAPASWTS